MLKILLNSLEYNKYLSNYRFAEFPNSYFDRIKQEEWFKDTFVRTIISEIDNAYVELGFSVRSKKTGTGYSVNDLSGGAKFLILAYEKRDRIYLATMGDNCTDLLEQIALEYEKEGKDLIIVSNYLHHFNFKYIHSIEYLNWNIVCHSWKEVCKEIYPRYLKHMEKVRQKLEETEYD